MKKQVSTTTILLTVIIIVTLGAIGAYVFLFEKIRTINVTAALLQSDIELKTNKDDQLQSIKKILADTSVDRTKLDSYFVGKDTVVDVIKNIETLAKETGLHIEIEAVDKVALEENDYKELLKFRIKTTGSWSRNIEFIALLKNLPHQISFYKVNLYKSSGVENKNTAIEWTNDMEFSLLKLK